MIMQWVALVLGLLMAVVGGALKASDVIKSPGVAEYIFFSGEAYILMIAGLVLLILAFGYDILFESGEEP